MTAQPVKVQALSCPNCGGAVELRGFANTLTAVCPRCASVLDTSHPVLRVLHQFNQQQRRVPLIPLGSRGKFDGTEYQVIGFQVRAIEVEGISYEWSEYVLFNPYKGFRYLSEYNGHWNFIWPVRRVPREQLKKSRRPSRVLDGRVYQHFQNAVANTVFVLGEFPWRVHVGEAVEVDDYTCPPWVLSAERDGDEVTWSEGKYTDGKSIWTALGLEGTPAPGRGVYLNQPSPHPQRAKSAVKLFLTFLALLVGLLLTFAFLSRREIVFDQQRVFNPSATGESSYVTPVFELKGRVSNIEVKTATDLDNQWAFFGYSLINVANGEAWDFGREVSYYYGRDSDGSWTEGSRTDTAVIGSVPPGQYFLRVEPDGDAGARPVSYRITVRRDVPNYGFYLVAGLLLLIPVIVIGWRTFGFEHQRWQESDYASSSKDD